VDIGIEQFSSFFNTIKEYLSETSNVKHVTWKSYLRKKM